MNLTINTDASFHPDHKVGGFAFWMVCDTGRHKQSGPLNSVGNSTEAESMAIANALHVLLNSKVPGVTKIIINTDSKNSITFIKKRAKVGTPYKIAYLLIRKLKQKYNVPGGLKCEFRHVKAHSGKDDKRSWVNDWCDREAKKEMRKLVSKIQKEDAKNQKQKLKQLKA